ncbi:fluoride efflux transporter CrcB [Intrasporangium calvum]|uniref:Fluoride-specific ion channel FluC n=1 Tax=Intrasporangium calvum TaxID=53358 RepID=A0ABT5GIT8_9MICO|nr:fluoride efflux transporter CrcB [Intrasporangium calvum]MDC5698013.1 fluoride efflux transporter CrcB [Intrasporangium calvum]
MTFVLVMVGGAAGAPLRYVTDLAVQRWHGGRFPWGTLAVNVLGSLLLGILLGLAAAGAVSPEVLALFGAGLCGALTTYSTFGFETVRLVEEGALAAALGNVTLSLVVGIAAGGLGWALALAVV